MIGRERECDVLRGAMARAAEGGSAFVLVAGEPGIGKTTLLRALADLAGAAGFTVGYGRGEPAGAAPLWPWTSALQTADAQRRGITYEHAASPAGWTADPLPGRGASGQFAVFERFAAALSARTADGPVALFVDDLHWADLSALKLFGHLLDRPSLPGVLVAAGVRTTEPLTGDAAEIVSGLLAHPSADVVELGAFGEPEVAALVGERLARRPGTDEVALLARRSGGNPFFIGELLRWMPIGGSVVELDAALPLAVRESVRRRLVVEGAACQQVVKAAAVAGSAASLDLLTRLDGSDRADVGASLDAAERAGLLVVGADGSVTFAHDLVREAVISLLTTWTRLALHHAVGTALGAWCGCRATCWTQVAAHLLAARPLADDGALADAATRAAVEATRAGAFDEAAGHLGVALAVTEPAGDTDQRGELLLERGRVLWAAERAEESTAAFGEAIALARRTGNGALLARVALSWRGGDQRVILKRTDDRSVALLREALAGYSADDSRLRCLLLARLAMCANADLDDRDSLAARDEAVAMARRLGDPEALTSALGTRFYYCWRPELARERLAIADEILAVAVAADDPGLVAHGSYFRIVALLDLGWLRDAWNELDRFEASVTVSGQPTMRARALWLRATRHLALGERGPADAAADEACRLAERMGRPDVAVERLGQSLLLWTAEDRVDELVGMFGPVLRDPVTYESVVAMANGFGGRPVEARAALGAVVAAGLQRHPRDMMWIFGRCGLLVAAAVSGDRDAGRILYDDLAPYAGRWAVINPGIVVAGAVDHYLGLGAALLDRVDDAVGHLQRAAAAHQQQGAVPLALLSLHELTHVLGRRGRPGDGEEIARAAERIALLDPGNTVPIKPLLGTMRPATDGAPAAEQVQRLVLEGDTWLVEFAGARARLRDQRGLHHLRTLLERPGTEVPALTLAGAERSLAGSGDDPILDQRAMREYRAQITDLHADIDEATAHHDLERAARSEAELDVLVEQLAAATGFGGRSRRFNGADEKARVSVTKAIRSAIGHLGEQVPELGRHLTATVRTGSRCIYQPDPRAPHRWTTERL